MASPRSRRSWFARLSRLAVAAAGVSLVALLACSNQGEGERCDHLASNDGNDDCQDGLICYSMDTLATNPGYDACCPVTRTQDDPITVCSLNKSVGIDASSVIPDTGADSFVGTDGGQDATSPSTDAPADAPADASGSDGSDGSSG